MAQYNAGSIISELDVDRDPFTEGLRLAREQAEDFEDNTITATADVDAGEAFLKFDDLEMRADELDGRNIGIEVDVHGAAEAELELDALEHAAAGDGAKGGRKGGAAGGFDILSSSLGIVSKTLMGSGIAVLAGSLPGVLAAAGGAALGLGGAFTVALGGLIPFAAVAKSDFSNMQATLKDLTAQQKALNTATTDAQRTAALKAIAADTKALQGPAGLAAAAYQKLQGTLDTLKKETAPEVFGVMTQFFNLASSVLPKIEPLINATGKALSGVAGQLSTAFAGPGFSKFITFISTEIGPVLSKLADAGIKFGGGLASALEKSAPLINMTARGLDDIAGSFQKFTNSPTFTKLVDYMVQELPKVGDALKPFGNLLSDILTKLGPAVDPALALIKSLGKFLDDLATGGSLDDVVGLFKTLAKNIGPLLPDLSNLVNNVLNNLTPILEAILPPLAGIIDAILKLPADVLLGIAAAWGVMTLDMWAFDAAADANPIGAIILGLLGLALILDEVITHWSEIVKFLHGPWGTAIAGALAVVMPFIGIPLLIIGHWKELLAFFKTVWGGLKTGAIDAYNAVSGFFEKLPGQIKGWFNGAVGWLKKIGSDIVNGLWGGIKTAWTTVADFFIGIKNDVVGWVKGAINWLKQTGEDIIQGIYNGLHTAYNKVAVFFGGVKNSINQYFHGAIHWLEDTGKDIVTGLWRGIESLGSWLGQQVASFATKWIPDPIRHILGISSPSRYMADEIGKWIPLGIAQGIDQNAHVVGASMTKLAQGITTTPFNLTGGLSLTGSASLTPADRAQINASAQINAQLAQLINVTKQLPEQTGAATSSGLKPVLAQQTTMTHQLAKQRIRQGVGDVG